MKPEPPGRKEENFVKETMEKETNHKLSEKALILGTKSDGTPKLHKFDLVSEDGTIVIEVKSGKGIVGQNNRNSAGLSICSEACYFLSKVKAKLKILALTDRNMYDIFTKESDGIINNDFIEIRYFDMKKKI